MTGLYLIVLQLNFIAFAKFVNTVFITLINNKSEVIEKTLKRKTKILYDL